MTQSEKFISDIEAFLTRRGMSATAFGKTALNDPNFVGDLREGRQPSLGLVDRVYDFMKSQEVGAA
jgi:hypothetical protein